MEIAELGSHQVVVVLGDANPEVWDLRSGSLLCNLEPPTAGNRYGARETTEHIAVAALPGRLVVAAISDRLGFGWVWILTADSLSDVPSDVIHAQSLPGSGLAPEPSMGEFSAPHLLSSPLAVSAVGDRITLAAGAREFGLVGLWDLNEGLIGIINIGAQLTTMRCAAPDLYAIGTEFGFMILRLHPQSRSADRPPPERYHDA